MPRKTTLVDVQEERTKFYKHWHDQYRRNPKYAEWDRAKRLRALKVRMRKYDVENGIA
jgi:hypothetical protein